MITQLLNAAPKRRRRTGEPTRCNRKFCTLRKSTESTRTMLRTTKPTVRSVSLILVASVCALPSFSLLARAQGGGGGGDGMGDLGLGNLGLGDMNLGNMNMGGGGGGGSGE